MSKEHATSVFLAEEQVKQSVYSVAKVYSSKTLINFYHTARCHVPKLAIPQLRQLVGDLASFPVLVRWDLWWEKWHWGRFSLSTSVSSASYSFTDWSIYIYIDHPVINTV
jgi:hypothetical protein